MNKNSERVYERLRARYLAGEVPWDDSLPPPEVIDHIADQPPGRALDLGCGFGRASIYMANHGWLVDAVDFVPEAIAEARKRADEASLQIRFHLAEVTSLDFLNGPYDFALDVGCGHGLDQAELRRYRDQLRRLLRPGAVFLMFARLQEQETKTGNEDLADGPSALNENNLIQLFATGFILEWVERGSTAVPDQPTWASGWFRFRRSD